jgi:hypothetical protein
LARRSTPAGYAASTGEYGCFHSPVMSISAVCGAFLSGLSRASYSPAATREISDLIAIIASQNRSISIRLSLSVGSIMKVPATGNDMVGAWNP